MKGWKNNAVRGISLLLVLLVLPLSGLGAGMEISVTAPEEPVRPWKSSLIRYTLPEAGTVSLVLTDEAGNEVFTVARGIEGIAGQNSLFWNGTHEHREAPEGTWILRLKADGAAAEARIAVQRADASETHGEEALETAEPEAETEPAPEWTFDSSAFTPAWGSPWAGRDQTMNYWTLPMDIRNEEAVWQVLMSPITVVDSGDGEKAQVTIRKEPSMEAEGLGVVTCVTQGVHVLERGEEWSLIECYSSSFHDSKIINWNALVQGYVPTRFLREETPSLEMGMVVDKLTQRLYIFREGHLFSTLLVSTGLSNRRQPYNETRSGEFLLTSKVGDFASDNMICPKAIRFNKGDLLHEVPYISRADGTKTYGGTESRLGIKASHGCIRVQRKQTPEGVNMQWIWSELGKNSKTKILIWEDWQGRQIEMPAEDLELYYNPDKGAYYHSSSACVSLPEGRKIAVFHYGELEEEPYRRLKRCEYCTPVLRRAKIEEINETYAAGGDHDPILTEARESCPKKGK